MSDFVLGVDGGQTTTKCVLANFQGEIIGRGTGGGLTHLATGDGQERLVHALREAIASAWRGAGMAPQQIQAIVLGLTGVEAGTIEASTVVELLPTIVDARRVEVHSDAFTALIGAHLGKPGIIAIAGTGSIVLGINAQGERARAGGWGWLVGDEGSAVAIGRSGLLSAFYAHDGVLVAKQLEELFLRHFNVASMPDAKRIVYAPEFGQRGFAALAPLVAQAAEQGDVIAAQIIRDAAVGLDKQVRAVIRRLKFDQTVRLAPTGGAFEYVTGLHTAFADALRASTVEAKLVQPALPAVLGAVILALEQCDVDLEKVIPRLQTTAII
jgi:N-acetylglucosamine kinase-like BadF-type ATPase